MFRTEMYSKRGNLPPKEGDLTCMPRTEFYSSTFLYILGYYVWRTTNYRVDPGFPKLVSFHRRHEVPRAAASVKIGRKTKVYLFGVSCQNRTNQKKKNLIWLGCQNKAKTKYSKNKHSERIAKAIHVPYRPQQIFKRHYSYKNRSTRT